jgi:predicted DNA-binding transcriptional regulator YafY
LRYERFQAIVGRHDRRIEMIRSAEFSSPDLAQKLEVPEQTVYRDIDYLKKCGFCIRSEKHANGWAYHIIAESITVSNG